METYTESEGKMIIPSGLGMLVDSLKGLLTEIYPDVANVIEKSIDWLCEIVILTPNKKTH